MFSESRRGSGREDCHKNFPFVFFGEGFFELFTESASFWSDGLDDGFPFCDLLLFLDLETYRLLWPRQLCNPVPAFWLGGLVGLVYLWFWFQLRDGRRSGKLQVFSQDRCWAQPSVKAGVRPFPKRRVDLPLGSEDWVCRRLAYALHVRVRPGVPEECPRYSDGSWPGDLSPCVGRHVPLVGVGPFGELAGSSKDDLGLSRCITLNTRSPRGF